MASEALGNAYVLSARGADQLVEMVAQGSAPVASPGFTSHLYVSGAADAYLSRLESLVAAHALNEL